jgi:hypothetical protein
MSLISRSFSSPLQQRADRGHANALRPPALSLCYISGGPER